MACDYVARDMMGGGVSVRSFTKLVAGTVPRAGFPNGPDDKFPPSDKVQIYDKEKGVRMKIFFRMRNLLEFFPC